MKKSFLSIMIASLMLLVSSSAYAVTYEVKVGETLRLDLPSLGVEFMANGYSYTWEITPNYVGDTTNYDEYLSFTTKSKNYAVVKGLKASKLIGIQYTGHYYENGKAYTYYYAAYVKVIAKPVTSVSIKSSLNMEVGDTYTLIPTVSPSDAETTYSWSSNNSSIASVSQTGVVNAKSVGSTNITVKTENGKTSTCKVTVSPKSVTSVSIKSSLNMEIGDTYTLIPTIYPSGAETSYTWATDNGSVATVSQSGKVTAISVGTANVKVTTDNGKTSTCKVTVNTPKTTEYDVRYHIYENGKVVYNNTTLTDFGSIKVAEGKDASFTVVPDDGYVIDWIWVDYVDVKDQLVNNVLTLHDIGTDHSLTVSFEKDENLPDKPASTENSIILNNLTANIGTEVVLPICLTNKEEITALQMDLYLPEGIIMAVDGNGDMQIETSDRVGSKHIVDCCEMSDGSYRIICYSTNNSVFAGNNGELLYVTLHVGTNVADGEYEIMIKNIELSDKTGTAYTGQDAIGTITVNSYILGDTDNNGKHTINDAVCIINYILNQPNTTFIEAAADLDGNGKITINDAVLLISKYILGTVSESNQTTRAAAADKEDDYLYIDDFKMPPGEVRTVEVMMVNRRDDIKGLQCDITLPQGISFVYDDDAEEYVSASSRIPNKLSLSSYIQNANTLRIAGVCTGTSNIQGHSGYIFTLKVKADESVQEGMYEILLSNVELSYGEAICVADRVSALEIHNDVSGIILQSCDIDSSVKVYNLKGQRVDVSDAKNGIFIIGGKKVFIK